MLTWSKIKKNSKIERLFPSMGCRRWEIQFKFVIKWCNCVRCDGRTLGMARRSFNDGDDVVGMQIYFSFWQTNIPRHGTHRAARWPLSFSSACLFWTNNRDRNIWNSQRKFLLRQLKWRDFSDGFQRRYEILDANGESGSGLLLLLCYFDLRILLRLLCVWLLRVYIILILIKTFER